MHPAVLVCTSDGAASLWDVRSRAQIRAYRDISPIASRGVTAVGAPQIPGGPPSPFYFVAAQASKASLVVSSFSRDAPLFRCAIADAAISLAASPDGTLLAAGGTGGHVHVWDVATGELLRAWQAHYKGVAALVFSACGALLVSGGADGVVHAWDVASVTEADAGSGALTPVVSWMGHTMAITALAFTPGGARGSSAALARVVSASLDRTVRWWDFATRTCLFSIALPSAAVALAPTVDGRLWFAGAIDGAVYPIGEQVLRAGAFGGTSGGGGSGSSGAFVGHTASISGVAVTIDGSTLVTGSEDGSVRVWDVLSRAQVGAFNVTEAASASVLGLVLFDARPAGADDNTGAVPAHPFAPLRKHATPTPVGDVSRSFTAPPAVLSIFARASDAASAKRADSAFEAAWSLLSATAAAETNGNGDDSEAAREREASMRERIATLELETARWKAVATKMVSRDTK